MMIPAQHASSEPLFQVATSRADDPLYLTYVAHLILDSRQLYSTSHSPSIWLVKAIGMLTHDQMKLVLERRSLHDFLMLPTYPGRISVPVQWDHLLYGTLQIQVSGSADITPDYSPEFMCSFASFCGWLLRTLEDAMFSQQQRPQIAANALHLVSALSRREREVLTLMVRRYTTGEIAEALTVSKRTVEGHQRRMYETLHVASRHDAIQLALIAGLI